MLLLWISSGCIHLSSERASLPVSFGWRTVSPNKESTCWMLRTTIISNQIGILQSIPKARISKPLCFSTTKRKTCHRMFALPQMAKTAYRSFSSHTTKRILSISQNTKSPILFLILFRAERFKAKFLTTLKQLVKTMILSLRS